MKNKILYTILGWILISFLPLFFWAIWSESDLPNKIIKTLLVVLFLYLIILRIITKTPGKKLKDVLGENAEKIDKYLNEEQEENEKILDRKYFERYGKERPKN